MVTPYSQSATFARRQKRGTRRQSGSLQLFTTLNQQMKRIEITISDDLYQKVKQYRQLHRTKRLPGKPANIGELIKNDIEGKLSEVILYLESVKPPKIGRPRKNNHFKNFKHGTSDNSL